MPPLPTTMSPHLTLHTAARGIHFTLESDNSHRARVLRAPEPPEWNGCPYFLQEPLCPTPTPPLRLGPLLLPLPTVTAPAPPAASPVLLRHTCGAPSLPTSRALLECHPTPLGHNATHTQPPSIPLTLFCCPWHSSVPDIFLHLHSSPKSPHMPPPTNTMKHNSLAAKAYFVSRL